MKKTFILNVFVLILSLLCSPSIMAQNEAYVGYNEGNSTLTFYYDNLRGSRTDTTLCLNEGYEDPGWLIDYSFFYINRVVFTPSFANARPTSTYRWFDGMEYLESIVGMNYLNTENVTNMGYMFSGCTRLTSLDLSHFNTSNVNDMDMMFRNCAGLTSLDVSNFNTENVETMWDMFRYCSSLTSLDVSNFNTAKVVNMSGMFGSCKLLESIDVRGFNTENATNMYGMFAGCQSFISVDVSSFNTAKVRDMGALFDSCWALKSLDLSSFNTSNVENTWFMFNACHNLVTVYVGSDWSTASVTLSRNMFTNCSKIKGGKGTTYDSSHTDKAYARIDGGPSNPGYFTAASTPGDVNGDSQMAIDDVITLIDLLLDGTTDYPAGADVNGDGSIPINDVIALIDMLLGA